MSKLSEFVQFASKVLGPITNSQIERILAYYIAESLIEGTTSELAREIRKYFSDPPHPESAATLFMEDVRESKKAMRQWLKNHFSEDNHVSLSGTPK